MAIELGMRQLLLGQASITSLCPAQTINNKQFSGIFNEFAAQGFVPPYVTIHQISHDPMKALDGTTGMAQTEFDIDCWGSTYPQAVTLGAAVELFLKDYSGTAGSNDTIKAVLFNNKRHDLVRVSEGSDKAQHVVSLNFEIYHVAG